MNTKYRLSVRLYIIFITLITIYLSLNVFYYKSNTTFDDGLILGLILISLIVFITVLFDIHKLYDIVHYTIDLGLPFITLISSNIYTLLVISFVIITTICSRKILPYFTKERCVFYYLKEDTPRLFFFVAFIEFIKKITGFKTWNRYWFPIILSIVSIKIMYLLYNEPFRKTLLQKNERTTKSSKRTSMVEK